MAMQEIPFSHSGPVGPVAPRAATFDAWQALVAPGDVFRRPHEVLTHPLLARDDKRTILAAWASDANAVENAPSLRCLPGCRAEPVSIDAVCAALAELDRQSAQETARETARGPEAAASPAPARPAPRRLRRLTNLHRYFRPGYRDDDDDDNPPPCPVAALPRPRTPPSADCVAVPA